MKLTAKERSYVASEQFIHDSLVQRCERLVPTARSAWKTTPDPSIVILWPSAPIETETGTVDAEILAELPMEDRRKRLHRLVEMTKAYGVLIIELKPHALVMLFESSHGTRSWTMPIERHGDVNVLGKAAVQDDVEHYGLLWSPLQGNA